MPPFPEIIYGEGDFLERQDAPPTNNHVLGAFTSPLDPNEFSVVAVLRLKDFAALLTGDIDQDNINKMANEGLISKVEYLKVPHHGSKNGLTQELIAAGQPEIAVISVGKNGQGHPHGEILQLLQKAGVPIKRTDQDGEVEVVTDGEKWQIN
jgi:competence protein ComEC